MTTTPGALPIGDLLREASHRWLKGYEVLHILLNYKVQGYTHSTEVVRHPPSKYWQSLLLVALPCFPSLLLISGGILFQADLCSFSALGCPNTARTESTGVVEMTISYVRVAKSSR